MRFKYDKKYLYWGITAAIVIGVYLLGKQILDNWAMVSDMLKLVFKALRPIIIGLVLAYVLNPLVKVFEKYVFGKPFHKMFKKKTSTANAFSRGLSIVLALILGAAIVSGLCFLIIPELYVNIQRLVGAMDGYINNGIATLKEFSEEYPEIINPLISSYEEVAGDILTWAREKLLPNANALITNISVGIYGTFSMLLNIVVGVIVSVYVLANKEKYGCAIRKFLYAVFRVNTAEKIISLIKYTDNHIGGFLAGKILDSTIIGILSFIVFSFLDIPYTLLVSVVVGVTNIIPFFGPFIGAIPCGVLILLVNPMKALTFLIAIIIIQQLDGNIIGPKILGDKTGLDSFAVIFAILFSGGLFGFAGMILGVPLFATLMGILKSVCDKRLQAKNMPVEVEAYKGAFVRKNKEE